MPEYRILLEQVESSTVLVEADSPEIALDLFMSDADGFERTGQMLVGPVKIAGVVDPTDDYYEEEDE